MVNNLNVLILGGSNGVGKYLAKEFVKKGANVALVARRKNRLTKIINDLNKIKKGNIFFAKNLIPEGNPQKILKNLIKKKGIPDIVINCVGGGLGISDPFAKYNDWKKVWRFNAGIAIEINSYLLPFYQKRKKIGKILHISSLSSIHNNFQHDKIAYSTSKTFLNAYVKNLANFKKVKNCFLYVFLPGPINVEGKYWHKQYLKNKKNVQIYMKKNFKIGRLLNVEEVGSKIAKVALQKNPIKTGSLIFFK